MSSDADRTPRLLVVADLAYAGDETRLLRALDALAPVATDPHLVIQLRAKEIDRGRLERLAWAVRERLAPPASLVLNGDADLARALGYDGVHWPESALPDRVPESPAWHSAAAHSLDAIERAERAGADSAIFGAVYTPGSKRGAAAGVDALRAATHTARLPVIAIGGMTPERVAPCLDAGAAGVAVVSGILGASDPAEAARGYLHAINDALKTGMQHDLREEVRG